MRQAKTPQTMAIGVLMKKMKGQPRPSQSTPPRMGPRIGATRVVMLQMVMAAAAWRCGKIFSSSVWDSGISGPPQTPCITRNSTNTPSEGARPQRAEQIPKPIMPVTNTLTAPKRAASQPVSGTVTASATA